MGLLPYNIRNLTLIKEVSSFRRLATSTWGEPSDPTVYGQLNVDIAKGLAYLKRQEEASGEKITITHFVGRCLAQCVREYPASNTLIRFNRYYQRAHVDMFFQVAITNGTPGRADDLSGVCVRDCDRKGLSQIAGELRGRAEKVRAKQDKEVSKATQNLQIIPPMLLGPILKFIDFLGYSLNLGVPGMPRDPFGSAMVTSMGMFGIAHAWAPLFPPAHCPIVVMVGAIERRPWVMDASGPDERLEIRDILSLHVAFDHRIMDGVLAAQLTLRIKDLLENPDQLDALDAAQALPAT
jgi:pyruvate dehydrogenase E2 component (dihydrolipoamide acetyltransferase)